MRMHTGWSRALRAAAVAMGLALSVRAAEAQRVDVLIDTLAPAPAAGRAVFPLATAPIGPFTQGQSAATRTPTLIPLSRDERRRLEREASRRHAADVRAAQGDSRSRRPWLPVVAGIAAGTLGTWLIVR